MAGGSGGTTSSAGSAGTTGGGPGNGGTGGGGACRETDPPAGIAATCAECLDANDNPATDGCCQISDPIGLQLCQAVSACVRANANTCIIFGADVTPCHCGTRLATCDGAGQADGPCVAQFTAAAGRNITTKTTDSPSAAQVLARQGDPNYALGRSANIYGIAGSFCPAECGIGM